MASSGAEAQPSQSRLGIHCAQNAPSRFPQRDLVRPSGQMDAIGTPPPLSATLLTTPFLPTPYLASQTHRARRRLSGLHRRATKRARLQPSPRTSMPPSSTHPDPTAGEAGRSASIPAACNTPAAVPTRPRRTTAQSDIHDTILHPGTVRINVQGAFIVSDEPTTPRSDDYEHDPRDIRLPNHTAVVSHVAVDASLPCL